MFTHGNKLGNGRPLGSLNKITKSAKDLINDIVFDNDEFIYDWKHMTPHEKMEIRMKLARFIIPEPKEAPVSSVKEDYPLFVDSKEDALRLLKMTENGAEQVGGSIVFEQSPK